MGGWCGGGTVGGCVGVGMSVAQARGPVWRSEARRCVEEEGETQAGGRGCRLGGGGGGGGCRRGAVAKKARQ
ncbi:hypothetical protein E2562_035840 [Oryza meyeriana var. granulata]|uniref:Uncharacterized protein n=1 Tax=Oryza meyeriana var. granulata TaxID=110450 RepID=A0A6G1BQJ8_9ORYZ|nr:hypothetical protein E2562_035840 [Oryza meyeriana var. granulata]